jgi:putative membrane protein
MKKRTLLTGLMLALLLSATAFGQSGQSGSAGSAQGAAGASSTPADQGAQGSQTDPSQTGKAPAAAAPTGAQSGAAGAAGAAGEQQPAAAQGTPASEPAPAGSAQQGTGAEGSQPPTTAPATPSRAPGNPGAGGGSTPSSTLAATDKTFIRDAALGSLEAEELGRLAAEKATNPDVKAFGQKMADDHKQVNDTLKQVAKSLQYEPPSRPSSRIKSEKARLEKLSGADFDREFLNLVVKEHQKNLSVFERESRREAAPAGLKSFAGNTLNGLQDHIKMAQDLSSKVGAGGAGSPGSPGSPSNPRQR